MRSCIRNGRGQTREIFNKVHDTSWLRSFPWKEGQRGRGTGPALSWNVHIGSEVNQLKGARGENGVAKRRECARQR